MTERISKSEQKRRVKQLETVAVELSCLSDNDLEQLPASKTVKEEIVACRNLKGGARKRQVKYLAKILRETPVDEIVAYLASSKGSKIKENQLHHTAERLRDILVDEVLDFQKQARHYQLALAMDWPGEEITKVVRNLGVNEKEMRSALYQYAQIRSQNGYREVFRMIKAALEKNERNR